MLARLTRFIDVSLGRRLALGMCTMLLAGLSISTGYFVRAERREMEDILQEKGRTAVNILSPRIAGSMSPEVQSAMVADLRQVLEDRDFDYAYVFDDTHVLARASDQGVAAAPTVPPARLDTLRAGHPVVATTDHYMEILAPVMLEGKPVAGLGLGVSLDLLARQSRRIRLRLVWLSSGLLIGALTFISWWTRKTVAPLRQLTRGAERLSEGDLRVRVPVSSVDEVGTLALTFNHLAESLEHTIKEKDRALAETNRLYRNLKVARARLGQAERLSALGMLAAGVSHELNNPLGVILSTAGNLREALGPANPWNEDVAIIESETQRCRRIIQGLLNFAASGDSHPMATDINQLLRETFALSIRDERAHGLEAQWSLDTHLPELWIDPRQMQQVFLNLLLNAADAMEGRGVVHLRTGEVIDAGRRRVRIEFADEGCGIEPADLDHIFDPFFTTKKGGTGFGLGLAVSYGIIESHGGEISVSSHPGRGSVFTITLPLQDDAVFASAAGGMA